MKQIFASSTLVAEALGIREAVTLASNLTFHQVVFESDNQVVIEVCRGNCSRGEIRAIIEDINKIISSFAHCGFTWFGREGNSVAHAIASLNRDALLGGNWIQNPPLDLRLALSADLQGLWS